MTFQADVIDFAFWLPPIASTAVRFLACGWPMSHPWWQNRSDSFWIGPNIAANAICLWSAIRKCGTHLAQSFRIPNSSFKKFHTLSFGMSMASAISHLSIVQHDIVHLFDSFQCSCSFWPFFTWVIFEQCAAMFKFSSPLFNSWNWRSRVPVKFCQFRINFLRV